MPLQMQVTYVLTLLSEQTLHAPSFDLEMLPWFKEHELAQLL
jgi:hypothetical protein